MSKPRSKRISEEIRKIVAEVIRNDIKDPRVSKMATVTGVETTRDLRYATIYVSVFDDDDMKQKTIEGLNRAKGFVRRAIGDQLDVRYTPEPIFKLDESIENAIHLSKIIREVQPEAPQEAEEEDQVEDEEDEE
ncbi:30S ribosome-binding factor RbfA [Fusibacter sp. JL216-2]|uniref:30S ribosome-binding factor RbfA n=1 Tax=Fusibacter sp. JL216-2 TaxID=3071453 RepID=UPI003D33F2F7